MCPIAKVNRVVEDEAAVQIDLEIRWMATGGTVCSVPAHAGLRIAAVKEEVSVRVGVPVVEQRLFAGERELEYDDEEIPAEVNAILLVRSASDPLITDLAYFRDHVGVLTGGARQSYSASAAAATDATAVSIVRSARWRPPLLVPRQTPGPGCFTQVRRVCDAIYGEVFEYRLRRSEGQEMESVAVKKMVTARIEKNRGGETDERSVHLKGETRDTPEAEDALTEIAILWYLATQSDRCVHLLQMFDVFVDATHTLLVTEFADGGELFDVAASGQMLQETQVQTYVGQLLQAVVYLHKHCIGHRDISLENILLKGGSVRLMDFGMAVRSHSASGTPLRFYRCVGKKFYRAPECYVPTGSRATIVVPAGAAPGSVVTVRSGVSLCEARLPSDVRVGRACSAELWGYAARPADVFAIGICLFILGFRCPLWEKATFADQSFHFAHVQGKGYLRAILQMWGKKPMSEEAMCVLSEMLDLDSSRRPMAADLLSRPWLAGAAPSGRSSTEEAAAAEEAA